MCCKLTLLLSLRSRYAMRMTLERFTTLLVRMLNGLTRACKTTSITCTYASDLLLPGSIAPLRSGCERPLAAALRSTQYRLYRNAIAYTAIPALAALTAVTAITAVGFTAVHNETRNNEYNTCMR